MKLQRKLSKLLLLVFFALVSANSFAETRWEVAAVFLGANEDSEFQSDVEKNLLEISKIKNTEYLRVQSYREIPGKVVSRPKLLTFLKNSFKSPASKKALILYGHGEGPAGLRDMPTKELKAALKQLNIKVDILWLDACFLANIEFLYELRNTSHFTIASEEAEFSAGLPFETLNELPAFASTSVAAANLAGRFIESYSYLKNGEQRDYVSRSSATISVIDNQEIDTFVTAFKKVSTLIAKLPVIDQVNLKNRLTRKFSMDDKSLVDLGHLLIELRLLVKDQSIDLELTKLIRLLNIESVKKLKSNPRVRIFAPELNSQLVFGFNNWENGFQNEYTDNPLFKEILSTNNFVEGPNKNYWPSKKLENKSTLVTPFAPGITSFDYYFLDVTGTQLLTDAKSIVRTHDIVETPISKKIPGAFLVYTAYTQQIGAKAERYTGVNITLFNTAPSMDYFEMEFNQKTSWLAL